jgi:hypothetical protein
MLGGIQVTVWMIGGAHTLLRFSVDSAGAGHGDHTGPIGLGATSAHRIAEGAGRNWNGVLTRKSVSHVRNCGTWILRICHSVKMRPSKSPLVRHCWM